MKNSKVEELPLPNVIKASTRAMEVARIWLVDGGQVVTLSPNLWKNPGTWGLMLVDLARHVAAAYEEQGHDKQKILEMIHNTMQVEWSHPTDQPQRKS